MGIRSTWHEDHTEERTRDNKTSNCTQSTVIIFVHVIFFYNIQRQSRLCYTKNKTEKMIDNIDMNIE